MQDINAREDQVSAVADTRPRARRFRLSVAKTVHSPVKTARKKDETRAKKDEKYSSPATKSAVCSAPARAPLHGVSSPKISARRRFSSGVFDEPEPDEQLASCRPHSSTSWMRARRSPSNSIRRESSSEAASARWIWDGCRASSRPPRRCSARTARVAAGRLAELPWRRSPCRWFRRESSRFPPTARPVRQSERARRTA